MKHILYVAAATALLAAAPASAGSEDYVGEVSITAASWCPVGTLEATGQVLQVKQYQALYSLLGSAYGGDGKTTFALPDLRNKFTSANAKPLKACIAVQGAYPQRP